MITTISKCAMTAKTLVARQRSLVAIYLALSFIISGSIASSALLAKRSFSSLDESLPKLRATTKFDAGEAVEGFRLQASITPLDNFLRGHLPAGDHRPFKNKLRQFCNDQESPGPADSTEYALSDLLQHLYAWHYAQTHDGSLKQKGSPSKMVKSIMANRNHKEVMLGDFLNNFFPQGIHDDKRVLFIRHLDSKYELNFKDEETPRNFYLLKDLISNLCGWLYLESEKITTVSFKLDDHKSATDKIFKDARLKGIYDFPGPLWPPMSRELLEYHDSTIIPKPSFDYAKSHSTLTEIEDRFSGQDLHDLKKFMRNAAWEDYMTTPNRVSKRILEEYYGAWKKMNAHKLSVISSRAAFHVKKYLIKKSNPIP